MLKRGALACTNANSKIMANVQSPKHQQQHDLRLAKVAKQKVTTGESRKMKMKPQKNVSFLSLLILVASVMNLFALCC
jgi:hypothetical protein